MSMMMILLGGLGVFSLPPVNSNYFKCFTSERGQVADGAMVVSMYQHTRCNEGH